LDTKSRNFNSLKLKKTIAVILAAVTLFLSGLFACFSIKGAFFYNRYETLGNYTDTDSFRKLMNSIEYELINSGEYKSCSNEKELALTSGARKSERERSEIEKTVRDACDFLEKSGIETVVDGNNRYRYKYQGGNGTFYYTYDGSFISKDEFNSVLSSGARDVLPTTFVSDEEASDPYDGETLIDEEEYYPDEEAIPDPEYRPDDDGEELTTAVFGEDGAIQTDISEALKTVWNLTNGLNYGEKSTDGLVKEALKYIRTGTDYDEYTLEQVNELAGVKYAVFYKTTGKVYSNCGVKADFTREQILEKTGDKYVEIYDGGEYSVIGAGETKAFPIYGNLSLYPAYLELDSDSIEDIVEKAYFSCNTSCWEGMTGVGQMAFLSYVKASCPHNRYSEESLAVYGVLAVICFIFALACCLFRIITAGKTDSGEVKIGFFDKVPFAINLALSAGIVIGFAALVIGSAYYEHDLYELFVYNRFPVGLAMAVAPVINYIQAVLFALGVLIVSGLIASMVRNIRNKTFFKHTFIYCIITPIKFIFRKIRGLCHSLAEKAKQIYATDYAYGNGKKFLIISAVVIAAVLLFNFILLFAGGMAESGFALFVGIVLNLIIAAVLILFVICFDRIASGVTQIKLGSLTCDINTRLMPGFMRSTAEDISKIREGLKSAVDQAVKDQAMKAELITNVTHDLKTPLTSIITYVDLLKREGPDGEHSAEYIDVIDEKSQRLKKLVDDLVQASKASSGAINLSPEKFDLCEFASQAVGEYADELKGAGVELILKNGSEPITVFADPNLTGRIFENLVSNIKKYAMSGTRAYLEITRTDGYGTAVFKNISDSPLNYDTDRLTERFYRGDGARSGEGSGLGLSITEDLCKLQSGVFSVSTDGDLFKASVSLPLTD